MKQLSFLFMVLFIAQPLQCMMVKTVAKKDDSTPVQSLSYDPQKILALQLVLVNCIDREDYTSASHIYEKTLLRPGKAFLERLERGVSLGDLTYLHYRLCKEAIQQGEGCVYIERILRPGQTYVQKLEEIEEEVMLEKALRTRQLLSYRLYRIATQEGHERTKKLLINLNCLPQISHLGILHTYPDDPETIIEKTDEYNAQCDMHSTLRGAYYEFPEAEQNAELYRKCRNAYLEGCKVWRNQFPKPGEKDIRIMILSILQKHIKA